MAISTAPKLVKNYPDRSDHTPLDQQESLLSRYFQEVAPLPVLQPRQEFEMAERIESREVEAWTRILSHPQLVEPILRLVEARLDQRPTNELAQLRRAVRASRSRSVAAQRRLERWAGRAGEQIRKQDVDRELLDEVVEAIRRLRLGERHATFTGLRIDLRNKSFVEYVRSVLRLSRAAQRARDAFIEANLRLVVTIARRFNFGQIPFHDLIQEGNIGLIRAVGRFDHRRGFRFSTYASWWIRHAITRAMADKGRLVRVPVHTLSTYQKVARTSRELNTKLGRTPTIEEICSSADLDEGKVKQLQDRVHMQIFSLDSKIDDEEDQRRFIELMPDDGSDSPSKSVGDLEVFAQVREIWDELKPIEADVLRRRFGLADGNEETLVEIGESHNLSRERIRQIQEQALDKIRGELLRRKAM